MRRELLQALREPNITERVLRIAAALQKLSAENWRGMLAAFAEEKEIHGREHGDVRMLFAQRAGEIVGREAIAHFVDRKDDEATRAALTGWSIAQPEAALQWLGREASEETRRRFLGAAIRGLALTEPDLAIQQLEAIPIERRRNYTNRFVDSLIRASGLEKTEALVNEMMQRAAAAGTLKDGYVARLFWDLAHAKLAQARSPAEIAGVSDWLQQHVGQPYVEPRLVGSVIERFAAVDPLKTFDWLEGYNRKNLAAGYPNTVGYDFFMQTWTQKDGLEPVGQWLGKMDSHPHYDRIAQRYSTIVMTKNTDDARRWAETIKDPKIRATALADINAWTSRRADTTFPKK